MFRDSRIGNHSREQRSIVAYLDVLYTKVGALRCLQAETGAELDALMPT